MEAVSFSDIVLFLGSFALIVLVVLFGAILLYAIKILRTIYEVVVLAKSQANGITLKVDDIKKYVGGSTMMRLLMFFFARRKR